MLRRRAGAKDLSTFHDLAHESQLHLLRMRDGQTTRLLNLGPTFRNLEHLQFGCCLVVVAQESPLSSHRPVGVDRCEKSKSLCDCADLRALAPCSRNPSPPRLSFHFESCHICCFSFFPSARSAAQRSTAETRRLGSNAAPAQRFPACWCHHAAGSRGRTGNYETGGNERVNIQPMFCFGCFN